MPASNQSDSTDTQEANARAYCEECDTGGPFDSLRMAETIAEWHNEEHHGGEPVAEVEEGDRDE